jgi:hypothetical protein
VIRLNKNVVPYKVTKERLEAAQKRLDAVPNTDDLCGVTSANEKAHFNNTYVGRLRLKLLNYDQDSDKEERVSENICKYCYYIDTDRIAGQAFTKTNCRICDKEMVFQTTITDRYCSDCSSNMKLCKYCGATID